MPALEMAPAEYARHAGVTRQAVSKMMETGKIPFHIDRKGRKVIDAAAADLARGANLSRVDVPEDDETSTPASPATAPESSGLTKAKTETEFYKGRLAQLEYEERVGKLRPTAEIEAAALKCNATAREVVHQLRQWADALASAAAREGVDGVRAELRKLERDMLTRLGEAFGAMAAGATASRAADETEEPA